MNLEAFAVLENGDQGFKVTVIQVVDVFNSTISRLPDGDKILETPS